MSKIKIENKKDSYIQSLKFHRSFYKNLGLKCFPVKYKDKTPPLLKYTEYYDKEIPEDKFPKNKRYNLAILWNEEYSAIDIDREELAKGINIKELVKETLIYMTGRENCFQFIIRIKDKSAKTTKIIYYTYDDKGERKENEFCSIRSKGTYSICPPSIHPSGKKYTLLNEDSYNIMEFETFDDFLNQFLPQIFKIAEKYGFQLNIDEKESKSTKTLVKRSDQSIDSVLENEKIRPCIKEQIKKIIRTKKHSSHEINLAIGSELVSNGYIDTIYEIFKHSTVEGHEYNEKVVKAQLKSIVLENKIRQFPRTCNTLSKYELCLGIECKLFNSFNEDVEDIPLAKIEVEKEFKNILPIKHLFSKFYELFSKTTDAYPEYFFQVYLFFMSLIVGKTFRINLIPDERFLNIYLLCVGDSSISRKSTSIDVLKKIDFWKYYKKSPDIFSPEGFYRVLSENNKIGFCYPELSRFLSHLNKSYAQGFKEELTYFYDCPEVFTKSLSKEDLVILDMFTSFIGGIQPSTFLDYFNEKDLRLGLIPRMLITYPTRPKQITLLRPFTISEYNQTDEFKDIIKEFHELTENLLDKVVIDLSLEALDFYNNWCMKWNKYIMENPEEDIMNSYLSRLQQNCLKVAGLLVMGDPKFMRFLREKNGIIQTKGNIHLTEMLKTTTEINNRGRLIINKDYMKIAIYYMENLYLPSFQRFYNKIVEQKTEDCLKKMYNSIIRNQGISYTRLMRITGIKKREFIESLDTLLDSNLIKEETLPSKRGRPKRIFYALNPDKDFKNIKKYINKT